MRYRDDAVQIEPGVAPHRSKLNVEEVSGFARDTTSDEIVDAADIAAGARVKRRRADRNDRGDDDQWRSSVASDEKGSSANAKIGAALRHFLRR